VPKSACSFYYVYGLLHSPQYRSRFAADLKKMLPRIPAATYREQFDAFTHAGRSLSDLHLGYETAKPYPLAETVTGTLDQNDRDTLRVNKMRFKSKTDHSALIYNSHITLSGIPDDAHRYRLGHARRWNGSSSATKSRPTQMDRASSTTPTPGARNTTTRATSSTSSNESSQSASPP